MSRKLLYFMTFVTLTSAGSVAADEIVKWVDENGVTHFGNAQFAPQGAGERVEVHNANGMDAPNLNILDRAPEHREMNGVVVERAQVKNPRGWRGYWKRSVDKRKNRRI